MQITQGMINYKNIIIEARIKIRDEIRVLENTLMDINNIARYKNMINDAPIYKEPKIENYESKGLFGCTYISDFDMMRYNFDRDKYDECSNIYKLKVNLNVYIKSVKEDLELDDLDLEKLSAIYELVEEEIDRLTEELESDE